MRPENNKNNKNPAQTSPWGKDVFFSAPDLYSGEGSWAPIYNGIYPGYGIPIG